MHVSTNKIYTMSSRGKSWQILQVTGFFRSSMMKASVHYLLFVFLSEFRKANSTINYYIYKLTK